MLLAMCNRTIKRECAHNKKARQKAEKAKNKKGLNKSATGTNDTSFSTFITNPKSRKTYSNEVCVILCF